MEATAWLSALEVPLSQERLAAYGADGADAETMLTRYLWNVALCEALYPALGALEVSPRNALHGSAAAYFSDPSWFDQPGLLGERQVEQVAQARDELRRAKKVETVGRIVAALNLGFWVRS